MRGRVTAVKRFPGAGAVELGGLEQAVGHLVDGGEEDDGRVAEKDPDDHERYAPEGLVGTLGKGLLRQAERFEDGVKGAAVGAVEPFPEQDADDAGHDDGQVVDGEERVLVDGAQVAEREREQEGRG